MTGCITLKDRRGKAGTPTTLFLHEAIAMLLCTCLLYRIFLNPMYQLQASSLKWTDALKVRSSTRAPRATIRFHKEFTQESSEIDSFPGQVV